MERTLTKVSLLLFCLLQSAVLFSQSTEESLRFQSEARDKSILFRSHQARRYNLLYEGTYYWDSPDFVKGNVFFNGKWYEDVLLNIDAFAQEVQARPNENRMAVTLRTDQVDMLTMGESRFINLRKRGYPDMPEGFYELILEGNDFSVYRRVDKRITRDINSTSGGGIIYDLFEEEESFYLERDGQISQLRTRRTIRFFENPAGRAFVPSVKSSKRPFAHTVETATPEIVPAVPDSLLSTAPLPSSSDFKIGEKTIYTSLATGFFDTGQEKKDDELLRLLNAGNEMVTFANKVYEIGNPENAKGDRAVVRGVVRDVLTGEPLIGVAVFDDAGKAYTMTDNSGSYQISLPIGENTLGFSGYSLDDLHLNVMAYSDGGLDVVMKEKVTSLKGAVVSAESMVHHRDARMGIEKVRINTIQKVPSAFGESDVLKVVLTLPGVKSTGEASTGFNVRGGSTDQNLVLFNDGTIYNPTHLFGIFSAFNTDVINDIELYKSSIPSEFGGRISSVLDVRGREGNSNKVQGSLGLGLLTSRFHLEGPIGKNHRTTFIVGGRTTYSNWIFNLIPKENSSFAGGKASFSDLNASITHRINDRNTIHAYAYWSRDKFTFYGDTTFRYSNLNASVKWRSTVSDRTTVTTVAGYDNYSNIVEDEFNLMSGYNLSTGIGQEFLKSTFKTVLNDKHTISYGLHSILYGLNPGIMTPLQEYSFIDYQALDKMTSVESAAFLSDTWKPAGRVSFDLGLRYSAYAAISPNKKYYGAPEFRASGKYSFLDNLSMKAGFNTMNQYIHLISNTASVSPMDAWHLSDDKLKPQSGWQAAAGLYWTVADNRIDLSVETYYKHIKNFLDYKSGAVLIMNPNLADDLVCTFGRAYGVELMAKKDLGKLNGWVSYTYSRSFLKEMEDRGVETINGGGWYCAPHDKPHDFKLVGNYKFTHRYSLSVNVDYSTGRPVTIPMAAYSYGGAMRLAYSYRNGYRVPDYFRMDLAMNIDPGHYLRKLTHMSWTIGVYNLTGRKNAYSVYFTTDPTNSLKGYKLSVFASPIPYVNLNLKFG